MTVLEITGLRGGYGESDILHGLALTLDEGEILTVAGTNGAGKSTLARAVVGLLPRVSGTICAFGRDLARVPAEERVRLGIGYVPQVSNVFATLTVAENLQVVFDALRSPADLADLFELFPVLRERRRERAGALSGGERQQLAFARALAAKPKLMVLDEPTAALSPAKVSEAFALIARLPSLGAAVLIVEQRARQALAISTRGCILDQGLIALSGSAGSLLDDPRAAELYLGQG